MTERPILLAVPNVSEGRDAATLDALARAFAPSGGPVRLLDTHVDGDHHRSVLSAAGPQGTVAEALVRLGREAAASVDLRRHEGLHPRVGVLDVAPVVYLAEDDRGAACAEALTAAEGLAEAMGAPVFLYGQLATAEAHRERAALRAGGPEGLADRLARGELVPDYGPSRLDPRVGAVLVSARPPLIAFNVDLVADDLDLARRIAAGLRESSGGLPGVRAIGLRLDARGRAQVSTNVHDHRAAPLRAVVEAVAAQAEIAEAELVGLAPRAALEDFPAGVTIRGFDAEKQVIENALRSSG